MQLIFDDCGEMAISKLLKQYLGDSVRFAGGKVRRCG